MLLVTSSAPVFWKIPPPENRAVLPDRVLLQTSVPTHRLPTLKIGAAAVARMVISERRAADGEMPPEL